MDSINLRLIRHTHTGSATLSYRIAPAHTGQGLATETVHLLMEKAFHTHGLQRLEATAHPKNPAAISVLLKNGFQQFGHSRCSLQLHRQWFDLLYLEVHAQPLPPATST